MRNKFKRIASAAILSTTILSNSIVFATNASVKPSGFYSDLGEYRLSQAENYEDDGFISCCPEELYINPNGFKGLPPITNQIPDNNPIPNQIPNNNPNINQFPDNNPNPNQNFDFNLMPPHNRNLGTAFMPSNNQNSHKKKKPHEILSLNELVREITPKRDMENENPLKFPPLKELDTLRVPKHLKSNDNANIKRSVLSPDISFNDLINQSIAENAEHKKLLKSATLKNKPKKTEPDSKKLSKVSALKEKKNKKDSTVQEAIQSLLINIHNNKTESNNDTLKTKKYNIDLEESHRFLPSNDMVREITPKRYTETEDYKESSKSQVLKDNPKKTGPDSKKPPRAPKSNETPKMQDKKKSSEQDNGESKPNANTENKPSKLVCPNKKCLNFKNKNYLEIKDLNKVCFTPNNSNHSCPRCGSKRISLHDKTGSGEKNKVSCLNPYCRHRFDLNKNYEDRIKVPFCSKCNSNNTFIVDPKSHKKPNSPTVVYCYTCRSFRCFNCQHKCLHI